MTPAYIVRRVLQIIPVFIGITLIVFLIMHLTPGDPVEIMMGKGSIVSGEEIERLRHELGLDKPLVLQYLSFLAGTLHGDFGRSIIRNASVTKLIADRLPATFELTILSIIISLVIAIPAGIISSVKRYSLLDNVSTVSALVGVSMPSFWLGLLLIIVFSVTFKILPVTGRVSYGHGLEPITNFLLIDAVITGNWSALVDVIRHLLLPSITLGCYTAALTMRVTRSSMLEVLSQDYIRTAWSKGLAQKAVIFKHALRNALIPTVTVVTLHIGILLGGNMIVESVFGWPGLGRLVINAIYTRDYPLVQGAVLVYAFTYVVMNFVADLLYTVLNPKVRL
ncbi:ABC transporter permease [Candidatus Bipolaricaulota bacterium]|nr:ABC transporter permease [Candidatus Bipolaricaulota bacterium]